MIGNYSGNPASGNYYRTGQDRLAALLAQQNQMMQNQLQSRAQNINTLEQMHATSPSEQLKKYYWQENEAVMQQPAYAQPQQQMPQPQQQIQPQQQLNSQIYGGLAGTMMPQQLTNASAQGNLQAQLRQPVMMSGFNQISPQYQLNKTGFTQNYMNQPLW